MPNAMHTTPETQRFIREHQQDNVLQLALQSGKYPDVDMPFAMQQIAGRQLAAAKIPSWHACEDILYPPHLSLEQCSSEATARYKASLVRGETLADLTGGFGVDCAFMAQRFAKAAYVEEQTMLCDLARHNFHALGLRHITVINGNGVDYLKQMAHADCIFIDPSRRDTHGKKTVAISDCRPDLEAILPLLHEKTSMTLAKLSPMLDVSQVISRLSPVSDIHVIAVNNECKELLALLHHPNEQAATRIHAVHIKDEKPPCTFTFTREEEQRAACPYAEETHRYIYEPNAAILKTGAYKCVAQHYHLEKLHPNSHLYTGNDLQEDFPGRVFTCVAQLPFKEKELKKQLHDLSHANISVRNFPLSVDEIRKKTRLKDGGTTYLLATTLRDERKVLLRCERIQ